MAQNMKVCDISEEAKEKMKKFRFKQSKTPSALILKVDASELTVKLDEEYEDITIDDLREELPERNPRFVALIYKWTHDDSRISYPLCFIYFMPRGTKPDLAMMYAGARNFVIEQLGGPKVFELTDSEDLTEEWLLAKLKNAR